MDAKEARKRALENLISKQNGEIYRLIEKAVSGGQLTVDYELPHDLITDNHRLNAIIEALKEKGYETARAVKCSGSCDYGCSCKGTTHLKISW